MTCGHHAESARLEVEAVERVQAGQRVPGDDEVELQALQAIGRLDGHLILTACSQLATKRTDLVVVARPPRYAGGSQAGSRPGAVPHRRPRAAGGEPPAPAV